MSIKLSILIPSVPERMTHLQRIVDDLYKQSLNKPVEILVFLENKKRTTGAKRNILLEQAQGEYVVFVDDDDRVESNYVETLLTTIEENHGADCIVFDVLVNFNGEFTKICKYGKEYRHSEDAKFYYRKPNHLMCYAKRIAGKHQYRNVSYGEDDEWGRRASAEIENQVRIPSVMYYYDFVKKNRSWYAK